MANVRITALTFGALCLIAACGDEYLAGPGQDLNAPAEVHLSAEQYSLSPGKSALITADVVNAHGDTIEADISWSSSDTVVATVADNGRITAKNPGEADITAMAGGAQTALLLTVLPHTPAEIHLTADRDTLDPHESAHITAVVLSATGDSMDTEVSWRSGNTLVADVDTDGVVTPRNAGDVTITAAIDDLEAAISLFIKPPFRFVDLSASAPETCAITEDGATYCWGISTDSDIPIRMAQNHAFVQITSEDAMSCGLTSTGEAYCWGWNKYQRMGGSEGDHVWNPVRIEHPEPFRQIHLGLHGGVCGIEESGTVVCWGHNDYGQVGRATQSLKETEILPVAIDAHFNDVSLGAFHGCGVAEDGRGYCWGSNMHAALGVGEETYGIHPPLTVAGNLIFDSVVSGLYFSCAVVTDERAYCWGYNDQGQLGLGDTDTRWTPTHVQGHRFSSLAAGQAHTCGVTTEAQALCWGSGSDPAIVTGDIEFQQLSAGATHTCGINVQGIVYCWGEGQLGRDDIEASQEPVPIMWPAGVGAD